MRFNTIGVSDGISMGTEGMSFSLQSRDLIADSIETVMGAQWYDGLISIPGCDKNMPGCMIAMGRLNRPAIMVYGGTIRAGHSEGVRWRQLDIVSAFQSYGEFISGKIDEHERGSASCAIPAPARAPAAACIRRTPWPPLSRRWACRCPTVPPRPRKIRRSWMNACVPAQPSAACWNWI